jgi:16S rRNA U516 pseudouridylate synthase RsuA-like enzyme
MRLSKYLAQTSICSRREAEKLIASGMILVDGKKVDSNVPVTINNKI